MHFYMKTYDIPQALLLNTNEFEVKFNFLVGIKL